MRRLENCRASPRWPVTGVVLAIAALTLTACNGHGSVQWSTGSSSVPSSATATSTVSSSAPPASLPANTAQPTSSRAPSRSARPTPQPPAAASPCEDSQLETPPFDETRRSADGHSAYTWLRLTNIGSAPCTLYGYGDFQLVNAQGVVLPSEREPRPGVASVAVTLQPGGSASKVLEWSMFPAVGGPTCQTPEYIRFSPQQGDFGLSLHWIFGDYCGPFDETPYHASG